MEFKTLLTFFVVVIFSFSFLKAQKIDLIQTDEDVNYFIRDNFNRIYPHFTVADTNNIFEYDNYILIADTLKMKYWYKEDFNNDSKTDLLVYGSYKQGDYFHPLLLSVIDEGKETYQLERLSNIGIRDFGKVFPVIKKNNNEILIIRYQTLDVPVFIINSDLNYKIKYSDDEIVKSYVYAKDFKIICDTLVYKYGAFIEYNPIPKSEIITEFGFLNHCGMISCFVMDIHLTSNGDAEASVGNYYEKKQNYEFTLDNTVVNQLFGLMSYINPNNLRNNYSNLITDDIAVTTTYTFEDGIVMEIYDYGASGTFGLRRLYDILFEFEVTKPWEK